MLKNKRWQTQILFANVKAITQTGFKFSVVRDPEIVRTFKLKTSILLNDCFVWSSL